MRVPQLLVAFEQREQRAEVNSTTATRKAQKYHARSKPKGCSASIEQDQHGAAGQRDEEGVPIPRIGRPKASERLKSSSND
jgi:hypothetical protein